MSRFPFTVEWDDSVAGAVAHRTRIARADLLDLQLRDWWCRFVFTAPALTADLHANPLDFAFGMGVAIACVRDGRSCPLVMHGSGERFDVTTGGDGWVTVALDGGSVEMPVPDMVATYAAATAAVLAELGVRVPGLDDRADVRDLARRLARSVRHPHP